MPSADISPIIESLLVALGENPNRDGLIDTPRRVSQSLLDLTNGYYSTAADVVQGAVFKAPNQSLVVQKGVEFYSLCEHHMLPFFGQVHVAYLPNEHIIGLSKIGRIIDIYARRLQLQERLTEEIAVAFEGILKPKGLAVVVEAQHFCMMMRGVKKQHGNTTTMALKGEFVQCKDARQEILSLLSR